MTVEETLSEARERIQRGERLIAYPENAESPSVATDHALAALALLADAIEAIATDTEGAHKRLDLHARNGHDGGLS